MVDYGICSVRRAVHMTATKVYCLFQINGSEGERRSLGAHGGCYKKGENHSKNDLKKNRTNDQLSNGCVWIIYKK